MRRQGAYDVFDLTVRVLLQVTVSAYCLLRVCSAQLYNRQVTSNTVLTS